MLVKLKKTVLFILAAALSATSFAQTAFTATITPAIIGKDETAQLSFTVENAHQVEQIAPPVLKGFVIVGGPDQQSSFQSINGVTKQSIGVSYLIRPTSTGNFTIDEATATVDGKIIKSNKVTLKVTKEPHGNSNNNQPQNAITVSPFGNLPGFDEPKAPGNFDDEILKNGENIPKKINKNIFIKVNADKTNCYVGEPIVVTYKLYTRLKAESNITKSPSFNGFSVVDLSQPDNGSTTIEKIDGREYNSYTIRKVQLYPLQAGKFDLDPTETDNTVYFIKEAYAKQQQANEDDIFNSFQASAIPPEGIATEHVTLQSKPLTITVNDLPQKNKPASFKGAVGNFTIAATVEKNKFSTDDGGKLTIVITGKGNMTLLNAPDIIWPDKIDGFEPATTESLDKSTVPVSGSKVFEYQFNVSKAGNYTLPSVEFSYFDTKEDGYKTITTPPIPLIITQGSGKTSMPVNSTFNNSTEKKNTWGLPGYRWLILSTVAIFVAAASFFYSRKGSKKRKEKLLQKEETTQDDTSVVAKIQALADPLVLTKTTLIENKNSEFYSTLNKEFKQFLSTRFDLDPQSINKKNIVEQMDKKGIAIDTSIKVVTLLDDIEWQLYTPFVNHDKMLEIYEQANGVVQLLNI